MANKLADAYVEITTRGLAQATQQIQRTSSQFQAMGNAAEAATHDFYVGLERVNMSLNDSVRQSGRAAGSFGKMGLGIYQLGQAAEDAAVGFGINGWSGALIGAANNLAFLASMMNPVLGGIVGIGTAVLATTIRMMGMRSATRDAADELKEFQRIFANFQGAREGISTEVQAEEMRRRISRVTDDHLAETRRELRDEMDLLDLEEELNDQKLRSFRTTHDYRMLNEPQEMRDKFYQDFIKPLEDRRDQIDDAQRVLSAGFRELVTQEADAATNSMQAGLADLFTSPLNLMSQLPEVSTTLTLNLEEADRQMREFMAEQNAIFEAQQLQASERRLLRMERNMEIFADEDRQQQRRQAEFGGIASLAKRLQDRANNEQIATMREVARNTDLSAEVLTRILAAQTLGAIAG